MIKPKIDADHTNLVVKWSDVDNSTFILAIGERKGEDEVHDSKLMVASHVDDSFAQMSVVFQVSMNDVVLRLSYFS